MTSIAEQSVEALGGPSSVLVHQRRDHVELDGLLQRLAAERGSAQDDVLRRIWRLVFPHAYAEETVLWPAARTALPDGEALTLRIEQEHQEVNALAARIDAMTADDPARPGLLARLTQVLREDVRDEEDQLLPRLQAAMGPAELRRLGRSWLLVRRTAPTRPHAVVSRRPPGNVLSALPLTALDRSRDVLDGGARRAPEPLARVLRAASRALASVAGTVERLPLLRQGERPSTSVSDGDAPG